jgi:hypothetical protein
MITDFKDAKNTLRPVTEGSTKQSAVAMELIRPPTAPAKTQTQEKCHCENISTMSAVPPF